MEIWKLLLELKFQWRESDGTGSDGEAKGKTGSRNWERGNEKRKTEIDGKRKKIVRKRRRRRRMFPVFQTFLPPATDGNFKVAPGRSRDSVAPPPFPLRFKLQFQKFNFSF